MKKTKKSKSKFDWLKKNIVIVPVVGAILAGTVTSVRYVFTMTDTIQLTKKFYRT
jgi:cobalamin synthase